jgi:ferredoxin
MRQTMQAACSSSGRSVAVRAAAPRAWNSHSSSTNRLASRRAAAVLVRSHKVQIEHDGKQFDLEVPDGKTILEVALDKGLDLPHDCKLGVCMTCPAKLVSAVCSEQWLLARRRGAKCS